MGKFNGFKNYFPSLREWMNYGCDIAWDDYTIMKNHGDYIQIMFPSSASKGHDTYDTKILIERNVLNTNWNSRELPTTFIVLNN